MEEAEWVGEGGVGTISISTIKRDKVVNLITLLFWNEWPLVFKWDMEGDLIHTTSRRQKKDKKF